jgi:hypothetical protein
MRTEEKACSVQKPTKSMNAVHARTKAMMGSSHLFNTLQAMANGGY